VTVSLDDPRRSWLGLVSCGKLFINLVFWFSLTTARWVDRLAGNSAYPKDWSYATERLASRLGLMLQAARPIAVGRYLAAWLQWI
jgi:hypothetical protein